jgi:hypothetical protein
MTAEDDVDHLIEQFTLAQGELLKGNPEPAKNLCSHRQDVILANPFGPVVRGLSVLPRRLDPDVPLRLLVEPARSI